MARKNEGGTVVKKGIKKESKNGRDGCGLLVF